MEITECLNRFAAWLARPSRIDGRTILAAVLAVCLGVISFAETRGIAKKAWRVFGVGSISPSFADLRLITLSWDARRQGIDPLYQEPGDPWKRAMNYPRLWLLPSFLGLGARHTALVGCLLATAFYVSAFLLIGRLTRAEALVYALALCSSSAMLAVERGNNDLFVFVVLAAAVLLLRPLGPLGYGLMLLAAMLKLYPIFTLLTGLREKKRVAFLVGGISAVFFAVYLALTHSDISQISKTTTRPAFWGYGCMTLAEKIHESLKFRGFDLHFWPQLIALGIAVGTAFVAGRSGWKLLLPTPESRALDSFRVGALVYIGSFLIGNNWNYRFIFLMFTIPQLLSWIKNNRDLRRTACLTLICILLAMWEAWLYTNVWAARFLILPVGEVICWTLFALLVKQFATTLPDWLMRGRLTKSSPQTAGPFSAAHSAAS